MRVVIEFVGLEEGDVELLKRMLPKAEGISLDFGGALEDLVKNQTDEWLSDNAENVGWQAAISVDKANYPDANVKILSTLYEADEIQCEAVQEGKSGKTCDELFDNQVNWCSGCRARHYNSLQEEKLTHPGTAAAT